MAQKIFGTVRIETKEKGSGIAQMDQGEYNSQLILLYSSLGQMTTMFLNIEFTVIQLKP